MTNDQITEAIAQMKSDCELRVAGERYDGITARGQLYTLGFSSEEADEVLARLFEGGFTYCLDPKFHKGAKARIDSGVCYFGPDQLLSRIQSCFWR
jgi:hypothetical protein